jgi:hypothetical protein
LNYRWTPPNWRNAVSEQSSFDTQHLPRAHGNDADRRAKRMRDMTKTTGELLLMVVQRCPSALHLHVPQCHARRQRYRPHVYNASNIASP